MYETSTICKFDAERVTQFSPITHRAKTLTMNRSYGDQILVHLQTLTLFRTQPVAWYGSTLQMYRPYTPMFGGYRVTVQSFVYIYLGQSCRSLHVGPPTLKTPTQSMRIKRALNFVTQRMPRSFGNCVRY